MNKFIRQLVTPLATIFGILVTRNPIATEAQALISQLQEDRHFGQIGKDWIEKLKSEGVSVIEKIGNVILRLEKEKDNILANSGTLAEERTKSDECGSLVKMIM